MPTLDPNHPEWKAFSEQMRAEPGNDTVRLVFADWVEEVQDGAAFAGLIRSMVEVSKTDPTNKLGVTHWDERKFPGQSNWNHYADAERFLKSAWALWSPINQLADEAKEMWRFHRGFPDKVLLDWRGLKYLDTLIAIGPVGEVEVVSGSPVTGETFPNTIQFSATADVAFASRCESPDFVCDRNLAPHLDDNDLLRFGLLKHATTHFLNQVWGKKVVRIRYEPRPHLQVWPTRPGAGVLLPWQDPLGMDRLNHSG